MTSSKRVEKQGHINTEICGNYETYSHQTLFLFRFRHELNGSNINPDRHWMILKKSGTLGFLTILSHTTIGEHHYPLVVK